MIYNQPSIYKQGGGGGGYKDGGELDDAKFIKVENNTVSTYENTSRANINYYFEYKDGDILNAVIELTNNVNATVHVYILQNGFYIPIGNIGGNSVNANENYNINIVGNSFSVEQVVNNNAVPEYTTINGNIVGIHRVSGHLFITDDLGVYETLENAYNYEDSIWKIPNNTQMTAFTTAFNNDRNGFRSIVGWNDGNGTNTTGINLYPHGYQTWSGTKWNDNQVGYYSVFWLNSHYNVPFFRYNGNGTLANLLGRCRVRLVANLDY